MSLVNFPGSIYVPDPIYGSGQTSNAMDTSTDKACLVFSPSRTGNIHKLHFRCNAFSSTATIDASIQTVSATTGLPTGTLWGTNTTGSVSVTGVGWYTVTLTADAAVTRGTDIVAFVLANNGSGNISVALWTGATMNSQFPYITLQNGSHIKANGHRLNAAIEYDDGTIEPTIGFWPSLAFNSASYTSATNPKTRALRFQIPYLAKIRGIWWNGITTAGASYTVKFYDSDGVTVLASITQDTDQNGLNTSGVRFIEFPSDITLQANTYYRVAFSPDANAFTLNEYTFNSTALMDTWGFGSLGHLSTTNVSSPTSESDWTQTALTCPFVGLIVKAIDVSSGSVRMHPGMAGGTRG